MSEDEFNVALLVGAVVLLLAVATLRLSVRTGLPSLLLYVALGMLLGEDVLGIEFNDPQLTQLLGYAALVIILAEGGLTTSWDSVRGSVPVAAALSTVGVGVSMAVTAAFAAPLLGLDARNALLIGAILASTDAAAVFSVLRRVPLPKSLSGALEAESGFNDAPVVIVVVALAEHALGPSDAYELPALLAYELTAGALIGAGAGVLGTFVLRRAALPSAGVFPLAVVALTVVSYGAATTLHASGFLAVYIAGLVLGNAGLPHRPATRGFAEGLAWLAQIGLFVMLGLQVDPSDLPSVLWQGLALSVVLLLVARPLSVLASVAPFRLPWEHAAFLSWAGLRGAVPIVLATVPAVHELEGADRVYNVVLVIVVVLTLVQGPTLPWVARKLRLADPMAAREVYLEASPLGRLGADLLEVHVPAGSRLQGVELWELRLPRDAAVALIVREGRAAVPTRDTTLRAGDELLLVVTPDARAVTERRLKAVSRGGRLARWGGPA
ncbi:potassium/proton antiporter [Motilibacter deserti]|uniref:Potassium/proton antiporter n=1 Tax=Motilibacter deserti TaxID=2714956 RepID=A0ABX0GZV0_9ACTN|nr:potassium/proton antiporter [Motilibacter deserti]